MDNVFAALSQACQQQRLDILWQLAAPCDLGPEVEWRMADEVGLEGYDVEVVVEMWPQAAMAGTTGGAGKTFAPGADATDIAVILAGEENIGTEIGALRVAL